MKKGSCSFRYSQTLHKRRVSLGRESRRGERLFAGRRAGRRGGEEGIPEEKGSTVEEAAADCSRPSVTGAGVPGSRSSAEENGGRLVRPEGTRGREVGGRGAARPGL